MLNMDMIGRLEGGTLVVHGVGTAEEWTDVLLAANESTARPLSIATTPEGFGPSDHASFYGEGLPVLHFFSNTHVDYHRPSDDTSMAVAAPRRPSGVSGNWSGACSVSVTFACSVLGDVAGGAASPLLKDAASR